MFLSPDYRSAVGFFAILLVLTFRPRGILGQRALLMENYLVAMAVSAGIYALMALGMNVIWGMAGLINLGLVGFFAVGAYVSALLTIKLQVPIAVGIARRHCALRRRSARSWRSSPCGCKGDYLAIVTLGFAETVRIVASNEIWLTNGTDGLSGIPRPFGAELAPVQFNLFYLCLVARAGDGAVRR